MADLLQRLEFKADLHADHLLVAVPDYRMDIEGGHDLVEEICRLYRYERIPLTVLADTLPPQRGNLKLELEEELIIFHQEILSKCLDYQQTLIVYQ